MQTYWPDLENLNNKTNFFFVFRHGNFFVLEHGI